MTEVNPEQSYATLLYSSPSINLTVREKRPPYNVIKNSLDIHKPWIVLTGSTVITSLIPTDPSYPKHVNHILIEDMSKMSCWPRCPIILFDRNRSCCWSD